MAGRVRGTCYASWLAHAGQSHAVVSPTSTSIALRIVRHSLFLLLFWHRALSRTCHRGAPSRSRDSLLARSRKRPGTDAVKFTAKFTCACSCQLFDMTMLRQSPAETTMPGQICTSYYALAAESHDAARAVFMADDDRNILASLPASLLQKYVSSDLCSF